jgi:hypothetical protein
VFLQLLQMTGNLHTGTQPNRGSSGNLLKRSCQQNKLYLWGINPSWKYWARSWMEFWAAHILQRITRVLVFKEARTVSLISWAIYKEVKNSHYFSHSADFIDSDTCLR